MLRETNTENGRVRGIPAADPRITAFKGIPFAAPPVGDLRWRAPQPVKNWEGVLLADHFGPISMQSTPGLGDPNALYNKEWHVDPEIPMDEDCLYLNVWTPAKTGNEKLPVMVWIFGGGMVGGYTAEMEFDGERIARRGVVFVSVNYRVNGFGFLAHPELTAESPNHASGNYGLLDQRAGIQWVKRNIANFGGDPENITIFGQSAGGRSVVCHLSSPLNRGLFRRAIVQSGGGISPTYRRGGYAPLHEAEKVGVKFLEFLGVQSIAEARRIDARTVCEKSMEFMNKFGYWWGPTVDGWYLPEDPAVAYRNGHEIDVPILVNNTTNELVIQPHFNSLEEFEAYAQKRYGKDAAEYRRICDPQNTGDIATMRKNGTYNLSELANKTWAEMRAKDGKAVTYVSRFGPEIPGDDAGAFHSSELWFTFETLAKCWRPFKGKHYDLARMMCNYWTNFAKTGDPNGLDADGTPMPEWKPYTLENPNSMFFGDVPQMEQGGPSPILKFLMKREEEKIKSM
ncbi:carboxylesterase/lipase family protein [Thermocaproicibacter melissae]|jgi:para-nitrobenzyl esterase|uniref:carboxylesterase/lipase family protein n=1 Tax=Thermocaproicibacter melissae TaxID=2966552 RepID=UPI0024B13346|nr:carboxylesterase family protein [Thermocaproicibacter melissae]WBY64082.1 carboxylesterase family protein [Thermocaproicibacter melissae]